MAKCFYSRGRQREVGLEVGWWWRWWWWRGAAAAVAGQPTNQATLNWWVSQAIDVVWQTQASRNIVQFIKKLCLSPVNTWQACPPLWKARYLANLSEAAKSMQRGHAVHQIQVSGKQGFLTSSLLQINISAYYTELLDFLLIYFYCLPFHLSFLICPLRSFIALSSPPPLFSLAPSPPHPDSTQPINRPDIISV